MDTQVIVTGTTVESLIQEIAQAVSRELTSLTPVPRSEQDDLLSREEAAKLLRITLPTLRNRTKEGRLKGHRMGNRVLYLRSEVIAALQGNPGPEKPRP